MRNRAPIAAAALALAGIFLAPAGRATATPGPAAGSPGPAADGAAATVVLYSDMVSGAAPAGSVVTVEVRSADGNLRAQGQAEADASDGRFSVSVCRQAAMDPPASGTFCAPVRIVPKDVVLVSAVTGAQKRIEVPVIRAHGDLVTKSVHGTAPPGAILEVTLDSYRTDLPHLGTVGPLASRQVIVGGAGVFEVSFSDERDRKGAPVDFLQVVGRVTLASAERSQIVLPWSVLTIFVDLDTGSVSGTAGAGRDVLVTARDATGQLLARGAFTARYATAREYSSEANQGLWGQPLEDVLGQPVTLRVGDRLAASTDDDALTVAVPPLDAEIDVAGHGLSGVTQPNGKLVVAYFEERGVERWADGAGLFRIDSPASMDFGWWAAVDLKDQQATFHRSFYVPNLRLELDSGRVATLLPDWSDGHVSLRRSGSEIARAPVPRLWKSAALRDPAGHAVIPAEGDVLVLDLTYPRASTPITCPVPLLTLNSDRATATIRGRFGGGRLEGAMSARLEPWADDVELTGRTEIDPTGRYTVTYETGDPFSPGSVLTARLRSPRGHLTTIERTVPEVRVAHGDSPVRAVGSPGDSIQLRLVRDSRPVASAAGTADGFGQFRSELRDGSGQRTRTREGDRVIGHVGAGEVDFRIDKLQVDLYSVEPRTDASDPMGYTMAYSIWESYEATVPPLRAYRNWSPTDRPWYAGSFVAPLDGQIRGTGFFAADREQGLQMLQSLLEQGASLAVKSDSGHQYYRHMVPFPRLVAHLGSDQVTGTIAAGTALELALWRGGQVVAGALVPEDGESFDARLRGPDGQRAVLAADDRITLELPQGVRPSLDGSREVHLEPLAVLLTDRSGLQVSAPPGRRVHLEFELSDGSRRAAGVTVGSTGRLWLAAVPQRAGWGFSQVTRVVASILLANGHEVVVEAVPGREPEPTPGPPATAAPGQSPAYLPITSRFR